MMETDHLNEAHGISQADGSPNHSPGKPMRQLEFNQAMSDFRHMFPETDEEVIEAVLRANSGMVDATIDQLLTMNIDAEQVREMYGDEDDLSDHILMSVEQEVMAQEQSTRESRLKKRQLGESSTEKTNRKELEDCPPSYTEAVKSHLSHHHRSSRHRHSPTSGGLSANTSPKNNAAVNSRSGSHHHHHHRHPRNGMQHLLDLGPESAPGAAATIPVDGGQAIKQQQSQQSSSKFHTHHHSQRASNHHRRRGDSMDSASPHKSRPGRNLLASNSMSSSHSPFSAHQGGADDLSYPRPRKSSLDSSDFCVDADREKSPSRWQSSYRERTSLKRPAFRNWNPPLLGTLPDDFLRITPTSQAVPQTSVSYRPGKPVNTHLHRAMSAVGPERPKFSPSHPVEHKSSPMSTSLLSSSKSKSSNKPHRSLSFAGHSSESSAHQRKSKQPHPSGLAQHEFSQDFLQERMKENEMRRLRMGSSGLDPGLAQYLADEKLAIMLQNSEFLQELRLDHQFMMTLERDHKDVEESNVMPEVAPEPLPVSGLHSDEEEGYGEDRRDTLEAFPFTQQLPPSATGTEDVELRKKLKHMGKASKRQFAALARKFFAKRKKKSAHQILKESQAPSMMNLLDDDDDDPEFDDLISGDHHSSSTTQYDQETHVAKSSSWRERRHQSDNL